VRSNRAPELQIFDLRQPGHEKCRGQKEVEGCFADQIPDLTAIIIGGTLGALFSPLPQSAQEHTPKAATTKAQIARPVTEKPNAGGMVRENPKDGLRYVDSPWKVHNGLLVR
jgi:hypothetical protein